MAKDAKKKGKKKGGADEAKWPTISVASHPRAARSISRAKAWAALLGFALVGLLSYRAGVEPFEACVRALIAGIALYLFTWRVGLALWQRLVYAEAKAEVERRRAERAEIIRRMTGEDEPGGGGQAAA